MTRLERIRAYVEQRCTELSSTGGDPFVEVQEVADALSIWRNDASKDLNRLVELGCLAREGKRPIHFTIAPSSRMPAAPSCEEASPPLSQRAFANIIGANGSLRSQLRTAKSALLYPPMGLHTLIVGETGVGKTMLAEEMWHYAKEIHAFGHIGEDIPFVRFNCAEYADNPQLLLSQLFGHMKNSFTGASETKPGLVEKADGGILFLDEIHRLSSTGQELLFTLLDKNIYRRLGDTVDRTATLMLVGSTSHDHVTALLDTFKRRIPVLIRLPNLDERPPSERLALIRHFFYQEAARLGVHIRLTDRALRVLMRYKGQANIGDLCNAVQLCCARSYMERQTLDTPHPAPLEVDVYHLSQSIYDSAALAEVPEYDPVAGLCADGLDISNDEYGRFTDLGDTGLSLDLYRLLEDSTAPVPPGSAPLPDRLQDYYDHTLSALEQLDENKAELLYARVLPIVRSTVDTLLDTAATALGGIYERSVHLMLAVHLQQFLERSRAGQIIYNPDLDTIRGEHPSEFEFLRSQLPWLSEALAISLPEDELGFLAMFLCPRRHPPADGRVAVLLIATDDDMSRHIADTINRVLGVSILRAVHHGAATGDPLAALLCAEARRADEGHGVLLLTDMPLLTITREWLTECIDAPCRVLPGLSLSLALSAGRAALAGESSLDTLFQTTLEDYTLELSHRQQQLAALALPTDASAGQRERKASAVITLCASGVGSAARMKELLHKYFSFAQSLEIIPLSVLDNVAGTAADLGSRLCLILGAMDPQISDVPFLPTEALFSFDGLCRIQQLLLSGPSNRENAPEPSRLDRQEFLSLVERSLGQFTPSMDSHRVMELAEDILSAIEQQIFGEQLPLDVAARLIIHTASMLERLGTGTPLHLFGENREAISQQQERFDQVERILQAILSPGFGHIPEAEVYYFLVSLP